MERGLTVATGALPLPCPLNEELDEELVLVLLLEGDPVSGRGIRGVVIGLPVGESVTESSEEDEVEGETGTSSVPLSSCLLFQWILVPLG